jgi:uncharacterized protein (TIGR02246 family)
MTITRSTEEAAVREVMTQLYAAWADNDADAFASHYVDEATVIMPGVLHQDSAAVRQSMAMGFNGPLKGSQGIDEPQSIRIYGDTAIVVSKAGILMPGQQQLAATAKRFATWVFINQAGTWKVASYANCPAH